MLFFPAINAMLLPYWYAYTSHHSTHTNTAPIMRTWPLNNTNTAPITHPRSAFLLGIGAPASPAAVGASKYLPSDAFKQTMHNRLLFAIVNMIVCGLCPCQKTFYFVGGGVIILSPFYALLHFHLTGCSMPSSTWLYVVALFSPYGRWQMRHIPPYQHLMGGMWL